MSDPISPPSSPTRRRLDVARRVRDLIKLEMRHADGWERVLPDERVLAQQFGVSRNALRDALGLLRAEGLVERRQGAGTLVLVEQLTTTGNHFRGMVHNLSNGPDRVHYEPQSWDIGIASPVIARLLGVAVAASTHVSERLTLVDEVPHCLWTTHLRLEDGRRLPLDDATRDGVDIISRALATPIKEVRARFEAVLSDESVAPLLRVPMGYPLLRLEQVLVDEHDRIRCVRFGRIRTDNAGVEIAAAIQW